MLGKNKIHRASRFQIDDNFSIHKQIKTKCIFKRLTFIPKADRFLTFNDMPAPLRLCGKKSQLPHRPQSLLKHIIIKIHIIRISATYTTYHILSFPSNAIISKIHIIIHK